MSDITIVPPDYIVKHRKTENIVSLDKHGDYVCDIETEYIPIVKGEWIDKGWHGDWKFEIDGRGNCWHEYECSECGFHSKGSKSNYCPNCGANMKEVEDEA